ncbi:MAG: hypothetical protein RL329_2646 [Bacteroidota bacterium]|jgi:predicted NUDIX family NTP pyrophosphohydrolase
MSVIEKAHLVIYRIRQKGLEVFLVNHEVEGANWELPKSDLQPKSLPPQEDMIELDPVKRDGETHQAYAVDADMEADWQEIPSLKSLIQKDVQSVADKVFGELEKHGTYFAIKDAFKKVLPTQYAFLKELKEVVTEKNSVRDL